MEVRVKILWNMGIRNRRNFRQRNTVECYRYSILQFRIGELVPRNRPPYHTGPQVTSPHAELALMCKKRRSVVVVDHYY